MSGGLLSLKWNNHQSTFLHVLSSLCLNDTLSDVTLACDGDFYAAHKLVLATCSEYFEKIFERIEGKHSVIVLKDVKSEELEALLSYMYEGEVNVLQEKLSGLIKAAEYLKIKGLSDSEETELHSRQIFKRGLPRIKTTAPREQRTPSPPAKRKRQDSDCLESPPKADTCNDAIKPDRALVPKTTPSCTDIQDSSIDSEKPYTDNQIIELDHIKDEPDIEIKKENLSYRDDPEELANDSERYPQPSDVPSAGILSSERRLSNPSVGDEGSSTSSNLWESGQDFPNTNNSSQIGHCFSSQIDKAIRSDDEHMTIASDDFVPARHGSEAEDDNLTGTFSCPYCPFKTFQKNIYDTHLRRHNSEKTFFCQFCSYSCMTKSNLKCHIRKHTGEKPFSCPHCSYRSAQSSNIKIHVKRMHKDAPQDNESPST